MVAAPTILEQRVILNSVSWETYEKLLDDLVDSSAPRLTFDRGTLEIVSPTFERERLNRLLAAFVEEAAADAGVDIESAGSTTFRRADLDRGFEPDSSFYIANVARVAGKHTLSLPEDPPPDLVIEIDITSGSIAKLPIYAQVGVPEVWRYDGDVFEMRKLEGSDYVSVDRSAAFPKLTTRDVMELLALSKTGTRREAIELLRALLRSGDD